MKKDLLILFTSLFVTFCFGSLGKASQQSLYGLGARAQALANSNSALPLDAYSQSYNPAVMQRQSGQLLSLGVQGAFSNFTTINQVQTCTTTLYGACPTTTSDVNTKTPDTFVLALGFKTPIGSKKDNPDRAPNLGLSLVVPLQQLLSINMQNSFLPQYGMYLSDTQTVAAALNFSLSLSESWSLGFGGQLYLTQTGAAEVELPTGGNSTGQLKLDARPGVSPVLGVLKKFGDSGHTLGLSYLGKQDAQFVLSQNAAIGLLPGGTGSPLAFTINSSIMFNPEVYILGWSHQNDIQSFSFSANYERWSSFASSRMVLNFQTFQSSFSQNLPPLQFKDTVSLHAGYQKKWTGFVLRGGYAFVPTPTQDLSGEINFVDSDKHEITLGAGFLEIEKWLGIKSQLDIAVGVHSLVQRQVVKTSASSLGYPGYKIGGAVWNYGVSLTTEL